MISRRLLLAGLVLLFSGCVSQVKTRVDYQVSNTLPRDIALEYLDTLDVKFNTETWMSAGYVSIYMPACHFQREGMIGEMPSGFSIGARDVTRSEAIPYGRWQVVRVAEQAKFGGTLYTIIARADNGATCYPLRYDTFGIPAEDLRNPQQVTVVIEKTLTALLSLGVAYNQQ